MYSHHHLQRQKTPHSSSNDSSRNATPTPRKSSSTPIPQKAYELLHKKYDRPKSKTEMLRLRDSIRQQEILKKQQQQKAKDMWLASQATTEKRKEEMLLKQEKDRQDEEHRKNATGKERRCQHNMPFP